MVCETANLHDNNLKGLDIIRYSQTVHQILNKLESENTWKLERTGETPVDAQGVNYQVIFYRCRIVDTTPSTRKEVVIEDVKVEERVNRFVL